MRARWWGVVGGLVIGLVVAWWLYARGQPARVQASYTPSPHAKVPPRTVLPKREVAVEDTRARVALDGQVLDPNGDPIFGAALWLETTRETRRGASYEHGWFSFEDVPVGSYWLAGVSDGLVGRVLVTVAEDSDPVTLRLSPSGSVRLLVKDGLTQRPLNGAEVSVGDPVRFVSHTDAAGAAFLSPLLPIQEQLAVVARGYRPAWEWITRRPAPGEILELEVQLFPGAEVSGVVLDAEGRPVEGASLSFSANADFFRWSGVPGRESKSDPDGRWQGPPLSAGTYNVSAMHASYPPVRSESIVLDGVTPREGIVLRFPPRGVLSGRVEHPDGRPVPDAAVWARATDAAVRQFSVVRTDAAGEFSFPGLGKNEFLVFAEAGTAASPFQTVNLNERDITGLVLRLSQTGTIAGVVVDTKGQAVAGETVNGSFFGDDRIARRSLSAVSDADGRFVVGGLAEDDVVLLSVFSDRYTTPPSSGDTLPEYRPGARGVRLVVEAYGAIQGRVLYDDGTPPAQATVSFFAERAQVAKDGRFLLEKQVPSLGLLYVEGPSFLPHSSAPIRVPAGETLDVGTITVSRGRTVSGRVTDAAGDPVEGAEIVGGAFVSHRGRFVSEENAAKSGPDGRYTLSGMPQGETFVVLASHPTRGTSEEARIPAGEGAVSRDLLLRQGSSLEGRVTYQGAPAYARLLLFREDAPDNFVIGGGTDDQGAYRFDTIVPGRYRVMAELVSAKAARDSQPQTAANVTIPEGAPARLDLAIEGGVDVQVTISVRGASPVEADAHLIAGVVQERTAGALRTRLDSLPRDAVRSSFLHLARADDVARFFGVPPGDYSLCARSRPNYEAQISLSEAERAAWPVLCQPLRVSASPSAQALVIDLP